MPLAPDPGMDGAVAARRLARVMADPRVQARLRSQLTHVSRSWTVPGLSGSSLDGLTVYVDRAVPAQLLVGTTLVPTLGHLIMNERVSRALMDALGMDPGRAGVYAASHTQHRVHTAGVAWPDWAQAVAAFMRGAGGLDRPPPDLDLRPWEGDRPVHSVLAAAQHAARGRATPASTGAAA